MKIRKCGTCHKWFEATREYFYAAKRGKDGLDNRCKSCNIRQAMAFAKTPKGKKAHKRALRKCRLKRDYGITIEDYERMENKQCGQCAICGELPENNRLCVDHNHTTNQIRGLLCHGCNLSFGRFEKYSGQFNQYLQETNNG